MSDQSAQFSDYMSIYEGEDIDEGVGKALTALQAADIDNTLTVSGNAADAKAAGDAISEKYTMPSGGIPATDLASAVQSSLGSADSAYQKPSGGIPAADMSSAVQSALALAGTALQTANNAGAHNSIYRGQYLGTSVTAEQWAAIGAGTFEDLYIGDYWTIDNINWRIAGFDYWLHNGNPECTTHHIVIVPDTNLVTGIPMNSANNTTGAYIGSDFYTGNNDNTGKTQCIDKINTAFGSAHILSHREYLKNAVTNGYESGGAWYDSTAELMTEQMVFGCKAFGNVINGANIPTSHTVSNAQLPLFGLEHSRICNRANWWLRDVVSASSFALAASTGNCNYNSASTGSGIRPAFGIRA